MNLFNKIINLIKSLFVKQKALNPGTIKENDIERTDDFKDSIQKDVKNNLYKKQILEEVEKNPEIIETLSYARLVQLNQLYEEKIKELKVELKQIS